MHLLVGCLVKYIIANILKMSNLNKTRGYTYFFVDIRVNTCYNNIIERRNNENTRTTETVKEK